MTATFHSNKTKKSSLIMVKQHALQHGGTPVYVRREACKGLSMYDNVELPDEFKIIDMEDKKGKFTTKDGKAVLKTIGF